MSRILSVVALLSGACYAQEPDRLLVAVCARSKDQLQQLIDAAASKGKTIQVPENADVEAMRAAIYRDAQGEIPGHAAKEYPGCEGVPKPAAPAASGKPKSAAASPMERMAEMLMSKKDINKDGKLSREEMQELIESTNKQAKQMGQAEVDFFKSVDQDGDGLLNRDELASFFKAQQGAMGSGAGTGGAAKASGKARREAKPKAATEEPDFAALMFKGVDKNGDGVLSREEMQPLIEQTNQQASNQASGETGEDFFKTMDKDGSGSIDKEEAAAFFASVAAMMGQGAGAKAKDEV